MMLKEPNQLIGQIENNDIFVFSSYGQLINSIKIPEQGVPWIFLDFAPDSEDIILISATGAMYLLDPKTGENRGNSVNLGQQFSQKGIIDGKLYGNSVVFRDIENQFYRIDDINNPVAPQKYEHVSAISQLQNLDYIFFSKRSLELLVTDQSEGFWVLKENTPSV